MATKTSQLPEREYIAILGLVMPLVEQKRNMALTPGDFNGKDYALEIVESLAAQRLDTSTAPDPVTEEEPE